MYIIIFFLLIIRACELGDKKVIITKEYVINPNWTETNNKIAIYKMKLKDSTKIISLKNPSEPELDYGLIEDTSFEYTGFVEYNGEDYAKRKIYFNKDNSFYWCDLKKMYSECNRKVLGELQKNTWYMLRGLSRYHSTLYLYYVYVDNLDSVHVFKVWSMTNY